MTYEIPDFPNPELGEPFDTKIRVYAKSTGGTDFEQDIFINGSQYGFNLRQVYVNDLKELVLEHEKRISSLNAANESQETFFFDQDESCHWYMIPTSKRELWNKLNNMDTESDEWYQQWQDAAFDDYRTGGGISDIEFTPVKK